MKYRAEIDGLRALAVMPVILFHAGIDLFRGGFVGVDVFFVISGYLITTILIEDIENKNFSIVNFYERRARRLLPALFVVMFFCIPFAWMYMLPWQMKDFSRSLVAVSLFVSNFLFWRESGYFDTAAEEKPFLHTWSLAVEEQYYLIFPILLLLVWRFGKNRMIWFIILIALSSLALSEYGWRRSPTANFFFSLTRAWEFLFGSIAAFFVQKRGVHENNYLSLIGLIAIVLAIFVFDETTPVPSIYTLLPVVGVVLVVLFAGKKTIVAKFLSIKLFVGIGLISYSAYLWHQPLFAFARIRSIEHPDIFLMTVLVLLSFVLAWFSWRYVEYPFRNKTIISRNFIFSLTIVGMCFFTVIGLIGDKSNGFERMTELSTETLLHSKLYVLGDSHAGHLISGLKEITTGDVIGLTGGGCIPFRNVDRHDSRVKVGFCAERVNGFLDQLKKSTENSIIILSTMGPVYLDGTTFMGKFPERVDGNGIKLMTDDSITNHYEIFEIGLRNTITELLERNNLSVVFAIDVPELGIKNGCGGEGKLLQILNFKVTDLVNQINIDPDFCRVSRNVYDERVKAYKELVYKVISDFPRIILFDPTQYFCNDEHCTGFLEDYGYLYADVDHLSQIGSLYYAEQLGRHLSSTLP